MHVNFTQTFSFKKKKSNYASFYFQCTITCEFILAFIHIILIPTVKFVAVT